jgi:hypothetical protein
MNYGRSIVLRRSYHLTLDALHRTAPYTQLSRDLAHAKASSQAYTNGLFDLGCDRLATQLNACCHGTCKARLDERRMIDGPRAPMRRTMTRHAQEDGGERRAAIDAGHDMMLVYVALEAAGGAVVGIRSHWMQSR